MSIKYAWKDKSQFDQLEKGLTKYLHRARVNFILENLDEIKELKRKNYLRIIDLGCGDGIITRYIATKAEFDVIGVDIDLGRLKGARNIIDNERIQFIGADIVYPCFKNCKADIILLHHVIEYIDDTEKALQGCFDLLKDRGYLILGIPNEDSIFGKPSRLLHKKLYEEGEHINFYSERSIITILKKQSFEIKKIGRIGFLTPRILDIHRYTQN